MRFEDFAKSIIAIVEKDRAEQARRAPEMEAAYQREQAANRRYQVGEEIEVFFDAIAVARHMAYGAAVDNALRMSLRLAETDRFGGYLQLSSTILSRAAEAVRHIEQWVNGEIDELAPSGLWPPPEPSCVDARRTADEVL